MGVYFHEMGHNFTGQSAKFNEFASAGSPSSNLTFSEGLATAVGIYAAKRLEEEAYVLGISDVLVAEIKQSVGYFGELSSLPAYVASGADYTRIDPNILDDILSTIAHEFGFKALFRLFSLFLPAHETLPFGITSDVEQSTVFIAAMGIAAEQDLRSRFRDEWGFPVDDDYYASIYPAVRNLVLQRGPEVPPPEDTSARFRTDVQGSVFADGAVSGTGFRAGSADVAEWVPASTTVQAGTVLELDAVHPGFYRLTHSACSPLVAGVVSTKPGVTLGIGSVTGKQALLALSGIVPVKVANEGGPIQPGDLLVSSSTSGYAMRWAGPEPCPCALVGKALEPMTDERGVISVLLTAH